MSMHSNPNLKMGIPDLTVVACRPRPYAAALSKIEKRP